MLPILPIAGLAFMALALGGSSAAPSGDEGVSKAALAVIASTNDPAVLYKAAVAAEQAGKKEDAEALLGSANYWFAQQNKPTLPYPPTAAGLAQLEQDAGKPSLSFKVLGPMGSAPLGTLKVADPGFRVGGAKIVVLDKPSPLLWEALMPGVPPTPSGVADAAWKAIKGSADSYIRNSAALGKLDSTIAVSSARIMQALIEGGPEAVGEALSVALAGIATGLCAATPAAPLAPLCGAVGAWAGKTMTSGLGTSSTSPAELEATRQARFAEVYKPLLAQVPDDRTPGDFFGTKNAGTIYAKAEAQLFILCSLWVDCITFAARGAYGEDLPLSADSAGDDDVNQSAPGGKPYGYSEAKWVALCAQRPAAFPVTPEQRKAEPLQEFKTGAYPGPATAKARERYWRFGNRFRYGKLDPTITPEFRIAASRILVSAKAEAERRFATQVLALAATLESAVSSECKGNKDCLGEVKRLSREIAYDSLANARGLPIKFGTPESIIADGLQSLRTAAHKYG